MLDEQVTDILLHAEKWCRKLRIEEVDYSSEVSKALERWYVQRLALKIAKGKRTNYKELNRLASKWNIDITNLNNIWSIKINIERSRRDYLDLKIQQEACRRKYLKTTERLAR